MMTCSFFEKWLQMVVTLTAPNLLKGEERWILPVSVAHNQGNLMYLNGEISPLQPWKTGQELPVHDP